MRVAVVGHHEWVTFVHVDELPVSGQIVHATDWWDGPGGGGAGAAGQLARLAGEATFFTAFGDDDLGRTACERLRDLGITVHARFKGSTRRAVTHIEPSGERTITVLGDRLEPSGSDDLPWDDLGGFDAVYFTAGDLDALRAARRARVLVATSRVFPFLTTTGVELDALVGSANDPSEAYAEGEMTSEPRLVVMTDGSDGGTYKTADGFSSRYDPVSPPGEVIDRYGAGDCFAAGLTFGLGGGLGPEEAIAIAALCGAVVVTGRGPFECQLTAAQL